MPREEYTYAVARIRSKELNLLTKQDLEQLLTQNNYEDCLRFLREKDWGEEGARQTGEEILSGEQQKTWALMAELVKEEHVFDVFLVPNDFHNLKVSIKAITRGVAADRMFLENGTVKPITIFGAVEKREYNRLPDYLQAIAQEAMTTLLQTSDGQLCDILIDRASMIKLYEIGQNSENEIIRLYSELLVASADIKIAVRCLKTKKSLEFIRRCLAPCESLNADRLAHAAAKSAEDIYSYLETTAYSGAVEALKRSPSAFEKWCDDLLTEKMRSQKWEPFTIGPLVAYIIARENEIKAVRMILSGKLNQLDDQVIRERIREMYV